MQLHFLARIGRLKPSMMIHHLKTKFYISFLALIVIVSAGTYVGYSNLKEMNTFLREMYEEHYTASMLAANLKARMGNVRAQLLAMMSETEQDKVDKHHTKIKDLSREVDNAFVKWFERGLKVKDERMNRALRDLRNVWDEFKTTRDAQLIPFIYEGKMQEAKALAFGIQAERYEKMSNLSNELIGMEEDEAKELINVATERFRKLIFITIGMSLLLIILYLIVSYYIMRKDFTIPLQKLTAHAQHMAVGDISHDAKVLSQSEIGDLTVAVNQAVDGMRSIILQTKELSTNVTHAVDMIDECADSINTGSNQQAHNMKDITLSAEGLHATAKNIVGGMEQLSGLSEGISSSTLEMAASIEGVDENVADLSVAVGNVSASIEEIAGSLKEVAGGINRISTSSDETASSLSEIDASATEIERHAGEAAALSNEVAKEGEKGLRAVQLSHSGMEKIKESVNILATIVDELGQRSKEIGKILRVIDDVATETNLLALNATIIAAQAGEHGKGFSVVAEEIRELSERTAASTKEIAEIISGIQEQIGKAINSVEEGIAKVTEGGKLSVETIVVLEGIMDRFKLFQEMSLKIARATKEQTAGSKRVTESLEAITKNIHQIARATQEQSQGSSQIVTTIERMKEFISQIKKATAEQAGGSKVIALNIENMMRSIQSINIASSDQEKETKKITDAIMETKSIADTGGEQARRLGQVVDMLKKEVDTLRNGIERFKLS